MSEDTWSNLDKVDQKIIEILNDNARTPSKEIASELKKSGHDVSDRTIRKRNRLISTFLDISCCHLYNIDVIL